MTSHINIHHLNDPGTTPLIESTIHILSSAGGNITLALQRRLQFGLILPDSLLLTNLDLSSSNSSSLSNGPYLIAFVDRSRRPETEVYLSCSWEFPYLNSNSISNPESESESKTKPSTSGSTTKELNQDCQNLLLDLLRALKSLPLPISIHQDILDAEASSSSQDSNDATTNATKDHAGFSRKDYGGHASNPSIMLWGAVHEATLPYLQSLGVMTPEYNIALLPNHHFTFRLEDLPDVKPLPTGLRWGEVQAKWFPLVRARTVIPRQDRTMALLPSVAIYSASEDGHDAAPAAWAFVGVDGSLTTLHVEADWRGKGLAKAVSSKLFREKMDRFWTKDDSARVAHGYVISGNKESVGVCKSLGGKTDHDVYWLRVDLSKL